jgi:hypothetical protein
MRRWRPAHKGSQDEDSSGSPAAKQHSIASFFKPKLAQKTGNPEVNSLKRPRDETQIDLSSDGSPNHGSMEDDKAPCTAPHTLPANDTSLQHGTPTDNPRLVDEGQKKRLRTKAQHKFAQDAREIGKKPAQSYTPLEKQVAELKRRHTDMLLFIEVASIGSQHACS